MSAIAVMGATGHTGSLVAHALVLLRRLDATERVGVGQSRDSRHPHPWVGVLRRDRRQQILRVVPKVIDRRSAH